MERMSKLRLVLIPITSCRGLRLIIVICKIVVSRKLKQLHSQERGSRFPGQRVEPHIPTFVRANRATNLCMRGSRF